MRGDRGLANAVTTPTPEQSQARCLSVNGHGRGEVHPSCPEPNRPRQYVVSTTEQASETSAFGTKFYIVRPGTSRWQRHVARVWGAYVCSRAHQESSIVRAQSCGYAEAAGTNKFAADPSNVRAVHRNLRARCACVGVCVGVSLVQHDERVFVLRGARIA